VELFFGEVMSLADKRGLLFRKHFSVDGTLIQAWASHKSFRAKDGSDDGAGKQREQCRHGLERHATQQRYA
jgi:hypothetical protein